MEERIKDMYNAAWKIYKMYLSDHDIAKYTEEAVKLSEKYNRDSDICNLLIWWAAGINILHEEYMRGDTNGSH